MEGYLKFVRVMSSGVEVFDGLPFMKMFLPLISVVGIVIFIALT